MKNWFRTHSRWLIPSVLLAGLLTQFTNCGTYSEANNTLSSGLEVTCTQSCITPTMENLSVHVNSRGADTQLKSTDFEFNIAGDCNEGGFPANVVLWELFLDGQKVRDSNMYGIQSASTTANTVCTNGRFRLYVGLRAIQADPVNRTGLYTSTGQRSGNYRLDVEIVGRDSTGAITRNSANGRVSVPLLLIN